VTQREEKDGKVADEDNGLKGGGGLKVGKAQ